MAAILNLPDWEILSVGETDDAYRIHARYEPDPEFCPKCGVVKPSLHRFGKRENVFADLPHHGKRTEIVVDRQRYKCLECRQPPFLEPLPHMDEHHDATIRMVRWIEQQALRRPFTQVAEQVEISEATVRRIFHAAVQRMEVARKVIAPAWLGIDEIHLLGKARCVMTDVKRNRPLDMLADHLLPTVTRRLQTLPGKQNVQVVTMDMWEAYRTATQAVMP